MPDEQHASILLTQYRALLVIAEQRGVEIEGAPSHDEAASVPDPELGRWIRMLRDVLRTPTS